MLDSWIQGNVLLFLNCLKSSFKEFSNKDLREENYEAGSNNSYVLISPEKQIKSC